MKLLECHVDNFGKLSNYEYRFSESLTEWLWKKYAGCVYQGDVVWIAQNRWTKRCG
jgi:hypothetical protein